MKFTVSYSRKVKAGQTYEMLSILCALESDTSIETMQAAFDRVKKFVEENVEKERVKLREDCQGEQKPGFYERKKQGGDAKQ